MTGSFHPSDPIPVIFESIDRLVRRCLTRPRRNQDAPTLSLVSGSTAAPFQVPVSLRAIAASADRERPIRNERAQNWHRFELLFENSKTLPSICRHSFAKDRVK